MTKLEQIAQPQVPLAPANDTQSNHILANAVAVSDKSKQQPELSAADDIKKLISDNLAVTAPSKPQEISAPAEQVTKQITTATNTTGELKDEILNKILGVIDDKQKTHDEILFGKQVAQSLNQQTTPISTVQMPKTESEKFIDKLKSYVVTPSYSSSVKIPDSSEEEDVGQPKYKMPTASPFNSDSENGQLFDTHA